MSVLVYICPCEGKIKNTALEAITYASSVAQQLNQQLIAYMVGKCDTPELLGKYGVATSYWAKNDNTTSIKGLKAVIDKAQATVVVFATNNTAKKIAPQLSVALKAALVTNVLSLPTITGDSWLLQKTVYAGKGLATIQVDTPTKIVCLQPNSIAIQEHLVEHTIIEETAENDTRIAYLSVEKQATAQALQDADKVVAGGLGLASAENWHLVTDLAKALDAAAACSRPVSDKGWRPHEEHVGQTGIQIAPNLYVAVGISGAIQHLGGVNRSKTIIAINKDAEAPILKIADYAIVGDLFEIVPAFTKSILQHK